MILATEFTPLTPSEARMTEHSHLAQFLGTRFHEDWTLDYGSSEDAVQDFVMKETPAQVAGVIAEIDQVLQRGTQISLQDLRNLGAAIDPTAEGRTPTDWLEWVQAELQRRSVRS